MPRYRNLWILALTLFLSLPILAAPMQPVGKDSFFARVVRLIKHIIPAPLDDISFPRP